MTDLSRLTVSLTKHGAHKLAILLPQYGASDVLDHLWGSVAGVKIEGAQARKNLSTEGDIVPAVWDKACLLGQDAVNALVLIGIIFSHHNLIRAMKRSAHATRPFRGTIVRGVHLRDKAYTNFAHILEELGYSTEHTDQKVSYDLEPIFGIKRLNLLVVELLELKLKAARWSRSNTVIDELLSHHFHEVFSISEEKFKSWLLWGTLTVPMLDDVITGDDQLFFETGTDLPSEGKGFVFSSGHNTKKIGKVHISLGKKKHTTAELLHNKMQNKLYAELANVYGEANVGTEVATGADTFIDLVLRVSEERYWFYEIKTAETVKGCIRQAIPQLLEYAYWEGDTKRAERLIIVGAAPATEEAMCYLELLRQSFGLPIYYEHLPVA
jgi:hypothetical protein